MDKIKKIYIVPHFHYDQGWVRTFEEYTNWAIANIVRVLKIMDKDPDYRFCLDQVILLEEFKRQRPGLWNKFKKRVNEGKIEIVCGMYNMPEAFIPSGESIVRNILYGKKWVKEELGVDVTFMWLIDVFGFSPQLPQIFKKSGYKYHCIGWKGVPYDAPLEITWQGIDGSEINGFWMPGNRGAYGICYPIPEDEADAKIKIKTALGRIKDRATANSICLPVGQDFSPPQGHLSRIIRAWNKDRDNGTLIAGTPSRYMDEVMRDKKDLALVKGELLSGKYGFVHPGLYSSRMWLKLRNRRIEQLLLESEKFATISWRLGGDYPVKALEGAWKNVIFGHFHDVMGGCSIDEVYPLVRKKLDLAEKTGKAIQKKALNAIVRKINTAGHGRQIAVFNGLSWSRSGAVNMILRSGEKPAGLTIVNSRGEGVLSNVKRAGKGRLEVSFMADDVPPVGYSIYRMVKGKGKKETDVRAGKDYIENKYFRLTVSETGVLTGIYDKKNRREVLGGNGNEIIGEVDGGDLYYYENPHYRPHSEAVIFKSGDPPGNDCLKNNGTISVWRKFDNPRQNGEAKISVYSDRVNAVITVRNAHYQRDKELLKWHQEIILYAGVPRIDFYTRIFNNTLHERIRVAFPLGVYNDKFAAEVPYGVTERQTQTLKCDGWMEKTYESTPVQNWMDYGDGRYGAAVINRGIPSHEIKDNTVYLTLLRSVDMVTWGNCGTKMSAPGGLEHGTHEFRYALYPHAGTWQEAKAYKSAYEHNYPLQAVPAKPHPGRLPASFSFAKVSPDNLNLVSMKRSESGDGLVLRFFETEGRDTDAVVTLPDGFENVFKTGLMEQEMDKISTGGKDIRLSAGGFSIETIKCQI